MLTAKPKFGGITKTSGKMFHGLVKLSKSRKFADEIVYVENSTFPRHRLKYRLIDEKKIEYKCQCCGLGDEWNGFKLSLQLDHINGVNNDNRLENLRFLCPNCHAQQGTYAGKNKGKKLGG